MIQLKTVDDILEYQNKMLVMYFYNENKSLDLFKNYQQNKNDKNITFGIINVYEAQKLTEFFEVTVAPTIIVLNKHKEELRLQGNKVNNIDTYLKTLQNKYTVLKFYADWCGPCKKITPLFNEMAVKFPTVNFKTINVDESSDISDLYKVEALPTFIILENENEVYRIVGIELSKISKFLLEVV
jgi:thioredoxin 1